MTLPSPVDKRLATAAVEQFFALDRWQAAAVENGWVFERTEDPLTFFVSMRSRPIEGIAENFALRLACDFYPTHPPDAIFVNPRSRTYVHGKDNEFVANLSANYCRTHLNFEYREPYKYGPQLVCSSMALGYYFSGHSPNEDQRWDPRRHTIGSTLFAIHKALRSEHYLGRHS